MPRAGRSAEFGRGGGATYRSVSEKAKALYVGRRFDEALSYWKTALVLLGEAQETTPVTEVLERADILVSMAALAQKRGRFSEADGHYAEAIEGMAGALGAERAAAHPMFGRALSDQAAAYYSDGHAERGSPTSVSHLGFENCARLVPRLYAARTGRKPSRSTRRERSVSS